MSNIIDFQNKEKRCWKKVSETIDKSFHSDISPELRKHIKEGKHIKEDSVSLLKKYSKVTKKPEIFLPGTTTEDQMATIKNAITTRNAAINELVGELIIAKGALFIMKHNNS